MKRTPIVLTLLLSSAAFSSASGQAGAQSRKLSPAEIEAVKTAVQDEIYDYGYFGDFYQIGQNQGTPAHWISRLHIYINPRYNVADGHGEVIYKLMPYGQIYRLYFLSSDHGVQLDGDPQNHFPITQPSHLTVYLDEDEVCRMEQTWMKGFITIDTSATSENIEAAAKRQKARSGFSYWEHEHAAEKDGPKN